MKNKSWGRDIYDQKDDEEVKTFDDKVKKLDKKINGGN
jgi:hypothetical protein